MLSPSMMCQDLCNIRETLDIFEKEKIEYLHIDVMDGCFVPNFALGCDYIKSLRKATRIPLDIHLMIEEPDRKLDFFEIGENDIVSVHLESTRHIHRALSAIRQRGAKPFVAINPGTAIVNIEQVLGVADGVLLMTVNPGFAGQKMTENSLEKIANTRSFLSERGKGDLLIEVDGNCSFENLPLMKKSGADIFVLGSSSVFAKSSSISENIKKVRDLVK